MTLLGWIQFFFFSVLLVAAIPFLGRYMAKVFTGEKTLLHPLLLPVEKFSYRLCRITPTEEMGWRKYAKVTFLFNLYGLLALFTIQLLQHLLPFNPQKLPTVPWPLALNTAVSFVTNTDWQAYSGETTMSYFTQMCGLTVQNFLSASTGMSAFLVLTRGFSRHCSQSIGNFWVDLVRTVIYLLLPLSFFLSLFLISQGVVQSLAPYVKVVTLENREQILPLGPAASQIAIKQLGTNGGGFFGANSAHPFENPTPLSNFIELFALLLIPASLTYTYGSLICSRKHGWLLFLAMFLLWGGGVLFALYSESIVHPAIDYYPLLEGKESRIGVFQTLLWSLSTTATANGSVNASLSSLSPLAGGVALFNIMLGEIIFGGIGVGLCSLLCFVLLTLFLSGLMMGRTPVYLGKQIEKHEIQWVSCAIMMPAALILISSALASVFIPALLSLGSGGPHGLSEILYTFSSTSNNNGSAFSGLNSNTNFYNKLLTLCMLLGRIAIVLPSIAIGGLMARKRKIPMTSGVFSIDTFLFLSLLIAVVVMIGALTYFPALSLGPIMEEFLMMKGEVFGCLSLY